MRKDDSMEYNDLLDKLKEKYIIIDNKKYAVISASLAHDGANLELFEVEK